MAFDTKYALIPFFIACSALGFYTTLGTFTRNGFIDVLNAVVSGSRSTLLGAPEPYKRVFTGLGPVDRQLALLNGFFSAIIDGGAAIPVEHTLFYIWFMGQFGAVWTVLLLEGRRAGNRGRAVSWIGTLGVVFQNVSWAVVLPLWVALHMATSPVVRVRGGSAEAGRRGVLSVPLWDLALIPSVVTLAYLFPGIMMSLPSLLNQSAATHWNWLAIWQYFPLWSTVLLTGLHQVLLSTVGPLTDEPRHRVDPGAGTSSGSSLQRRMAAHPAAGVYAFALSLAASTHLPIFLLSLLPAPLRSVLAAATPAKYAPYVERGTFAAVFVPRGPAAPPPSVVPTAYGPGDLAPLAAHFLQYDAIVGAVPLLLWALYQRLNAATTTAAVGTSSSGRRLAAALTTAASWTLVGGPHAAVAALLRDRDAAVLDAEKKTV